jgi:hypothetical protein
LVALPAASGAAVPQPDPPPLFCLPHLACPRLDASQVQATPANADTAPRDAASGLPTGKRMHKPYTLQATPDASTAQSAACAATPNAAPVNVASDPEEGGQVANTAAKVKINDFQVMKSTDKASPVLAQTAASDGACASGKP